MILTEGEIRAFLFDYRLTVGDPYSFAAYGDAVYSEASPVLMVELPEATSPPPPSAPAGGSGA